MLAKVEDKRRLGTLHQAGAVDMEAATVARWCHRAQIPFGCVRAISDEAATELSPRLESLLSGEKVSWLQVGGQLDPLAKLARRTVGRWRRTPGGLPPNSGKHWESY